MPRRVVQVAHDRRWNPADAKANREGMIADINLEATV